MKREVYKYLFDGAVCMDDVEGLVGQAIDAVECLFGNAATRLDLRYGLDPARRVCAIDCTTEVGRATALIFTGVLNRAVGPDGFDVRRGESDHTLPQAASQPEAPR